MVDNAVIISRLLASRPALSRYQVYIARFDTDAATQYLQLVAQSRDHRSVAIYHSDGNVFAASESEYAPGPLDRLLHWIHLIRDAGQIEQSLLNLMLNARDALANLDERMPSICLSADIVTLDGKAAALVADAEEGTFLRLQVSDNGAGMDETTRQRIFDPFFTTKSIGQGTGLGLSTVCTAAGSHASARLARARPSHSIFHQPPTRRAKPRRRPRNPQQPVAKRCWLSTTKNRCAPFSRAVSPLTAMRPSRPPMAAKASKSCSATTSI